MGSLSSRSLEPSLRSSTQTVQTQLTAHTPTLGRGLSPTVKASSNPRNRASFAHSPRWGGAEDPWTSVRRMVEDSVGRDAVRDSASQEGSSCTDSFSRCSRRSPC
jgi:hypothetical protein